MPIGLARYWDSLESAEYLVQAPRISDPKQYLDRNQQVWLSELSFSTEHECQTILYAKSLLNDEPETTIVLPNANDAPMSQKIPIGIKCHSLNSNSLDGAPVVPPPKPQRRIARLKNSKNETISSVSPYMNGGPSYSTLDLIEACKFNENYASIGDGHIGHREDHITNQPIEIMEAGTSQSLPKWTPPGFRAPVGTTTINISGSVQSLHKPSLPSYDQLRIKVERNGSSRVVVGRRPPGLRHTIAVNQEDIELARENTMSSVTVPEAPRVPVVHPPPSSPKSLHSDSTLSVDSGQCSGDVALTSQHSFSSSREEKDASECSSIFQAYQQMCLPGYARMASTMDHVLRTSSAIYSLLSSPSSTSAARDLLSKSGVFIQIVEASPCAQFLPKYDVNVVKIQISDLQRESVESGTPVVITNYFTIVLRKMVEQVLQVFARIISKYLTECGNKDRLVVIAVEHLIHLALFGDELCLETIQAGGLNSLVKLVRQSSTPVDTRRLLLRALAVLCGVAKGCLSLLSLGGLEVVLSLLSSNSIPCCIEAAGVLTQLTNPQHAFVQLTKVEPVLIRLLDLIDTCSTGESLLLVSAALSHVSLQDPHAIDVLYKHNAIIRLINAYNRNDCSTIFVQEQIVTVLSRLAARRYEDALIAQGAIPMLLEMLTVTDTAHSDYCRRIRYKAAVCIGTLAATGVGLKALYKNQAYAILCHVLEMENSTANPLNMICTNIRNKLESKYQIESAV